MSQPAAHLIPKNVLSDAANAISGASRLLDRPAEIERAVRVSYEVERVRIFNEQLARMPLDALKNASQGRLRLGAIESAGYRTVAAVRNAGQWQLEAIDGVGPTTSSQAVAAAEHVAAALFEVIRVRFDPANRPPEQTALLLGLNEYEATQKIVGPIRPELEAFRRDLAGDYEVAQLEARRFRRLVAGSQRRLAAREAVDRIAVTLHLPATEQLRAKMADTPPRTQSELRARDNIWDDYLARPVVYNGLLIEVAGLAPEAHSAEGFLPQDIVERIRAFDLDTSLLNVSLRGYQSFGAKFALVQRRTILGDEMGLGKTIEALATICHLRSHGGTHFLVVCPASVLANWEHEIGRHTRLERTWRLHGPDRKYLLRRWASDGGTAVTTFDTLRALPQPDFELAAVVIDEAHYVKNPEALRTLTVRDWLAGAQYALLMSGTPMENRVGEFKTLVNHVRPDIASGIRDTDGIAGADAFRKTVAPVYLRRNQVDVLNELPPKIETPEWVALEGRSLDSYRRAVAEGNFMSMRRAAFMTERPDDSPKLVRLLEIAEEAADNDRKVVVFSYFRDVLARIHEALGSLAVGPITGSVAPSDRQLIVDRFTAESGPGVLVSQIEAGGVGLNIQTASVVILTEPQWKPSTEEQAIARCHRMGQVRPVEVHRLLTENSVDQRMLEILARKSALFAEYVRASAMKDATPEAVDVTDDDRTNDVASQAEQERRIIELERRRLGVDPQPLPPPTVL